MPACFCVILVGNHLVARISWADVLGPSRYRGPSFFPRARLRGGWSGLPQARKPRRAANPAEQYQMGGRYPIYSPLGMSTVPFTANADRRHHILRQQKL